MQLIDEGSLITLISMSTCDPEYVLNQHSD